MVTTSIVRDSENQKSSLSSRNRSRRRSISPRLKRKLGQKKSKDCELFFPRHKVLVYFLLFFRVGLAIAVLASSAMYYV